MASHVCNDDFPIVCVGGSAGGLDAYSRLLQRLPPDLGVAVVIVNHLRLVPTRLHEILPQFTKMPVDLITEGMQIRPNRVFIIPAKRDLHVVNGEFHLEPLSKPRGWPDVITVFLRSLAQHWQGKLIAVIVSGYDGDGADALCEIREVGGVTIAQTSATAGQPDMPASAVESGCIDFILSPENIAGRSSGSASRLRSCARTLQEPSAHRSHRRCNSGDGSIALRELAPPRRRSGRPEDRPEPDSPAAADRRSASLQCRSWAPGLRTPSHPAG